MNKKRLDYIYIYILLKNEKHMKKETLILISIIIILLSSCNQADLVSNKILRPEISKDDGGCNAPADKCSIPPGCSSEHICLNIIDGSSGREFEYASIKRVKVTHIGTDCDSNVYSCIYVVPGGNPTSMGCVLPWCSTKCKYKRSVCLETFNGKTYIGDTTFSYPLQSGEGVYVRVYRTTSVWCDFGGIEKIDN